MSSTEGTSAAYRRSTSSTDPLTRLTREESGRVLALLARRFGLGLAEEAVQDALAEAARVWPDTGVPMNPPAWLMTVAKRKAIDRLRRNASAARRTREAALDRGGSWTGVGLDGVDAGSGGSARDGLIDDSDDSDVADDQLRLMLLCCHPALDRDTQVALTLRLVGGLTTAEIAAAFLVPEPTLAQRIVRAKRKIRDAGIPLSLPSDMDERIDTVLGVLYLIFNEGYLSRSGGDDGEALRVDLTDEAIRLTDLVVRLLPQHAETNGLLALQLFNSSRGATRLDDSGDIVLLERQDRSRWDRDTIQDGNAVLARALRLRQPGPYQLQAVIAAHHANAPTADATDWPAIVRLYAQLVAMTGSPVVRLNHAIAVAMADGPHAGLALLDAIEGLEAYHLFHAARGELLARTGDTAAASAAFEQALAFTDNPAERRHLERRRLDPSV
jgi:RNA polymerase sigma-70 factor (ECF subfamily)